MSETEELVKREWVYILSPSQYGIGACDCGNKDLQWSEYQKHVWCDKCQKDFKPKDNGVFGGPILLEVCALMGIIFDRMDLKSNRIYKAPDYTEDVTEYYLQNYLKR